MGLILFVLFVVFLLSSIAKVSRQLHEQELKRDKGAAPNVVVEEVKKWCPPHKWFYQEVKDTEGVTVRWRIVCELCGPLKPSNGPARMG